MIVPDMGKAFSLRAIIIFRVHVDDIMPPLILTYKPVNYLLVKYELYSLKGMSLFVSLGNTNVMASEA